MCDVHGSSRGAASTSQQGVAAADEFQRTVNIDYAPVNNKDQTVDSRVQSSAAMFTLPSLILLVFVIQLAIHLISTFGGQAINDLVYTYSHPNETDNDHTNHPLAMASLHQTPRTAV